MSNKTEITRRLLTYLSRHPEAQDTLEGIARWWLLIERIEESESLVEAALNDLKAADLVIEVVGPDSSRRFKLNHDKIAEINSILNATRGEHHD